MDLILYNTLLSYFKAVDIYVSPNELKLQLFSHPDTPSLYAVSETLNFLKIDNVAAKVEPGQLEILPDNFIAFLKNNEGIKHFAHIKKLKSGSLLSNTNDKFSKKEFLKRWDGIVLIADEENKRQVSTDVWSKIPYILSIFLILLFFWSDPFLLSFCIISIIGFYLSEEIFKTSHKMVSSLGEKICGEDKERSCSTVLDSEKYSIFVFSFNDFLFAFFASNLIFTVFSGSFNFMHIVVYTIALLTVLTTVFIQKFIARAWCPLCLLSSTCIVFQAIFVFLHTDFRQMWNFSDSLRSILEEISFFILLFSMALLIIYNFRKLRIENYGLNANIIDLLRFKRSQRIIEMVLSDCKRIDNLKVNNALKSSNNAAHEIRLVLSTTCSYCKSAFNSFYAFYQQEENRYQFQIIFNHHEVSSSKRNHVAANLIQEYQNKGFDALLHQLHNWFNNSFSNIDLESYSGNIKDENYAILFEQRDWSKENSLFHTPILIIDDIIVPEYYDSSFLGDMLNAIEENK
ncbi:hypothetical protein HME9304_03163 [Flagellimonas maritima]|uniref:Vitamin K epoxide reductase domain-containing protein n=1 Tax=Flagellimonas maritima TaxID=1383885 RepID=A0A2Z4LW31_9FLAO|nr:vitamin K epoxide reductase family protein [Allomuricauda aurantiaca]AWX46131.1 hypothetical protein HME9304_03163 [Allomuricauda aurantiaca]